jgi:hypothetical protein
MTDEEVAIKLEEVEDGYQHLVKEAETYRSLQGAGKHFVLIGARWSMAKSSTQTFLQWGFLVEGDLNVMVIDRLGKSVEDLQRECDGRFSLKTVLMLADQLIER